MLRWLNENAGAVQAISTVFLVIVTLYYAVSTWRLVRDGQLSRLAAFEPVLVPVCLTYRPVITNEGTTVVDFSLRLANSGQGTAYSVRPVLALKSGEYPGVPPKRARLFVGIGSKIQMEDKRPAAPAEDAISSQSYQDFAFRVAYGISIVKDGHLDSTALQQAEKAIAINVRYRTTFGREPTLRTEFVWSDDALVLTHAPETTGAMLS